MYFIINDRKRIIFGWSLNCGCVHVKTLFFTLTRNVQYIDDTPQKEVFTKDTYDSLDTTMYPLKEYTLVIFIRCPFERIISGFLDKENITFSNYVNMLNYTPQTSENWNLKFVKQCKTLKIFDIKNIDYDYIKELFKTNTNLTLLSKKILSEDYELSKFYNKDTYDTISQVYKDDLKFFKYHSFNYV